MMYNPSHPGETLCEDVLPALGLTITEAAPAYNLWHARQAGIPTVQRAAILH